MSIKFKENLKCRSFDVIVDETRKDLHFALKTEFIERHVYSPRGGSSEPLCKNGVFVKGKYRFIFMLNEEVADEYIRRMKAGK